MPIREYVCTKCGKTQEYLLFHNDTSPTKCNKCDGQLKPIISHSSFHLKGNGWYVTDYKNKKNDKKSK